MIGFEGDSIPYYGIVTLSDGPFVLISNGITRSVPSGAHLHGVVNNGISH